MSDLKACPFCGDEASYRLDRHYDDKHVIECDYCGCDVREEYKETDAIKAWNTRPIEDQLRAEVKALRDALNQLVYQPFEGTWWSSLHEESDATEIVGKLLGESDDK